MMACGGRNSESGFPGSDCPFIQDFQPSWWSVVIDSSVTLALQTHAPRILTTTPMSWIPDRVLMQVPTVQMPHGSLLKWAGSALLGLMG